MTTTTALASSTSTTTGLRFFAADDFDFAARTALGHAGMGLIDIGLVLQAVDATTSGDAQSWYDAWVAVGDSLDQRAQQSLATSTPTASALFLAASEAFDQSVSFVDGMADPDAVLLPTFRRHREMWDRFIATSGGRHLDVAVAYEGDSMPGYLLRPDASGTRRPTVVVTNGSDGALSGLWATIVKPCLNAGWNAFVFDGPGQQSMLFERDVPFRHDWEAVLTPVVDTLVTRDDVDANALLAYAISQGGYWLPRALAFEHRFVGAVVDGGVVEVARTWNANLPPELLVLLQSGDRVGFDRAMSARTPSAEVARKIAFRAKPYGRRSPYDLFAEVNRYRLGDLAGQITTPMLITDPDDEEFFPGQPQEVYDALTCPKQIVRFTAEQGANHHCEPMARALVGMLTVDFFTDQLARAGRG